MTMTLQAGDKLMSLADVSEMLGIPVDLGGRDGCLMSHIQKRADRRYRARSLDPDGRERSRTFTRKADAERHLAVVEGAKLSGAYVNDANPVTAHRRPKALAVR
jgi:hypothetical protein